MPDAGSEKEVPEGKGGNSWLGEATPSLGATSGPVDPKVHWSNNRKAEVVIRILRGEPLNGLSRELGVEIYRLEEWRDKALQAMVAVLTRREGDPLQSEYVALYNHQWLIEKNGYQSLIDARRAYHDGVAT